MKLLYSLLLALALPAASAVVFWRGWRERAYWQGWGERFGGGDALPGSARGIWLHAVSVGEVQAALPLIAALRAQWPELPLVISSATPAGRARARAAAGPGVTTRYAPYDLPWCVRGALRRLRPALLVIVETEVWPNLLDECARAGVPVLFASARMAERTAARLRRFPSLLQPALGSNVVVAAQATADAERFVSIGVPAARVSVAGNIKFERNAGPAVRAAGAALRARYAPDRLAWVAGSTHDGEEAAALAAHAALCRRYPDALLVLAPRHRPRFAAVAALLDRSGLAWLRHSTAAAADAARCTTASVLLLDTIGELEDFYAAADLAFVGGSLVPVGGHNLLEPAALGVATLSGPHQHNGPDIAALLAARGALRIVPDAAGLGAALVELAGDATLRERMGQAGLAVVASSRGALGRVLALVRERLA